MQSRIDYDAAALQQDCVGRYGRVLGVLAFDSEKKTRESEALDYVGWKAELAELDESVSMLCSAADITLSALRAQAESLYGEYLAACQQMKAAEEGASREAAPLRARMITLCRLIGDLEVRREGERGLRAIAALNSNEAAILNAVDRKAPRLDGPSLTDLERVNLALQPGVKQRG